MDNVSEQTLELERPRTFTLNGTELPCPLTQATKESGVLMLKADVEKGPFSTESCYFYFNSKEESDIVFRALTTLLKEAKQK